MSLLEIAMLSGEGKLKNRLEDTLGTLKSDPPGFCLGHTKPAAEFASLPSPRDPGDRAIVAAARVHGPRQATSDERIIEPNPVNAID
jgi:PIN domain nuclease of toxin-antitoxin system